MFYLYETYDTLDGQRVMIVEEGQVGTQYHWVRGNDGICRYARQSDAGRVTASNFNMSDPRNLVVPDEYAVRTTPENPFEGCVVFSVEPKE